MQTKAEILASNPNLISYRITLDEADDGASDVIFDCYAEDDEHATEQALNAYPGADITEIQPFAGND